MEAAAVTAVVLGAAFKAGAGMFLIAYTRRKGYTSFSAGTGAYDGIRRVVSRTFYECPICVKK